MMKAPTSYTFLSVFCGAGPGALGFLRAQVQTAAGTIRLRSVGGIDVDPAACEDFERLTGSPALCADMHELTAEQLKAFAGHRAPDVVFGSPPCKGFSALLPKKAAKKEKYQRLNRLVIAWIRLIEEAWGDDPPRLILMENVPRITSRGGGLLAQVKQMLSRMGYVFHTSTHDCGELGGLAQHRQRYLLVARHSKKCPPLLYQPPKRRVRACGEVLSKLPLPNDPRGGPMHRLPKMSWLNWMRLALIPAGGDWRDLPGVLETGQARREVFRRHHVGRWDKAAATIAGGGSNGVSAVADPRTMKGYAGTYGVMGFDDPAPTIAGNSGTSNGRFSVADPRPGWAAWGSHRVLGWEQSAVTVHTATTISSGAQSVADPRVPRLPRLHVVAEGEGESAASVKVGGAYDHGYGVLSWHEPSPTVAGGSHVGQGAYAVADGRVALDVVVHGVSGVLDWRDALRCLGTGGQFRDGPLLLVDDAGEVVERLEPKKAPKVPPLIISADGCWHRPLTTLELAALQGMPTQLDGEPLVLAGTSTSAWRERIGNAVPPPAAQAIAEEMLITLSSADQDSFQLSSNPVWVGPRWRPEARKEARPS